MKDSDFKWIQRLRISGEDGQITSLLQKTNLRAPGLPARNEEDAKHVNNSMDNIRVNPRFSGRRVSATQSTSRASKNGLLEVEGMM